MNRTQIFFLFAIGINAIYLIVTFVFFYFLDSNIMSIDNNDYISFYNAGLIVLEDLPNLYDPSLYLFPFRYSPLSAYFFTPFSLLGLKFGYITFQIFNYFLNFLNIFLIFRIIQVYQDLNPELSVAYKLNNIKDVFNHPENEPILHHGAVLLIMAPQFLNFFLGQVNILVISFILASVFYFLKGGTKNDLLGGLLLGCGILFKPTLIILILFIIPLTYDRKSKKWSFGLKQTILRLSGTVVLTLLSGIYFLLYPEMLTDFIEVNLIGRYTYDLGGELAINPSFSLTRILLVVLDLFGLNVSGFIVFVTLLLLFILPLYYFFVSSLNPSIKLIYGYFAGIVLTLLVYFDTWPHHLLVLAPFFILFLIFNKDFENLKFIKYIYYLLATVILAFWIIFYLTYQIFPLNIGGLVLLILLYYNVFLYFKTRLTQYY
ncbi:MAG: glycosyltransferase 87 family protein [Candidatus Hermodarchaeota archaeon]